MEVSWREARCASMGWIVAPVEDLWEELERTLEAICCIG